MPRTEIYEIELQRPDGVTVAELTQYIKEAVETWGGWRSPEDPLFYPWSLGKIRNALPAIRVRRRYP